VSAFLTSSHCKLRPNTEGIASTARITGVLGAATGQATVTTTVEPVEVEVVANSTLTISGAGFTYAHASYVQVFLEASVDGFDTPLPDGAQHSGDCTYGNEANDQASDKDSTSNGPAAAAGEDGVDVRCSFFKVYVYHSTTISPFRFSLEVATVVP
jgi:hypothetical protein